MSYAETVELRSCRNKIARQRKSLKEIGRAYTLLMYKYRDAIAHLDRVTSYKNQLQERIVELQKQLNPKMTLIERFQHKLRLNNE